MLQGVLPEALLLAHCCHGWRSPSRTAYTGLSVFHWISSDVLVVLMRAVALGDRVAPSVWVPWAARWEMIRPTFVCVRRVYCLCRRSMLSGSLSGSLAYTSHASWAASSARPASWIWWAAFNCSGQGYAFLRLGLAMGIGLLPGPARAPAGGWV